MSKSNFYETAILELLFNGGAIPNIADNAAASPLTNLYVSLHTADPGEAGDQETNECTYTGYARMAVARTAGGWTVNGNSVSPVSAIIFPHPTAGNETVTHIGIGSSGTGGGTLYYSGALDGAITASPGSAPPTLTTVTAITED